MRTTSPFILITGVSSGIGYGITHEFLKRGYHVLGSVRAHSAVEKLKKEFGTAFYPLVFDVTDEEALPAAFAEALRITGGKGLAALINNAGVAEGGPLLDMPMKQVQKHFEVNVFGLLRVTKLFLPLLGGIKNYKNTPGKIINITSVAGRMGFPFLGAYSASKFAVEGLTESLRKELLLYGIDAITVEPGNVITPIWDKAIGSDKQFIGSDYYESFSKFLEFSLQESKKGHTIEEIGKQVVDLFEQKNPAVRTVMVKNRMKDWTIPNLMPKRMFDRVIGKALGFK